jgi:DNA-binding GntR family transcriptional regulator
MATGTPAGPAVVLTRSVGERSLSQQVYDHLVDQIIHGQIKYGDTLNIKAMARQFGVSAMPIRDAIKRLETENIVAVRPRSNCYIRKPTAQTTLQAVESREMLELLPSPRPAAARPARALRACGALSSVWPRW